MLVTALSTLPLPPLVKCGCRAHSVCSVPEGEAASTAAGDVPLPIKINGTKAPCVLHEFHLPGSSPLYHLTKPPPGLSCPLGVFGIGQRPSIKGKGPEVNQARGFAHIRHTHLYTPASTCTINACTLIRVRTQTFCTCMYLFGF